VLAGYYRKLVNDTPFIAKPMTKLTQKHVKFQRIDERENNISTLNNSLVTSPILTFPEPGKHFIVYCDAFVEGSGVYSCKMTSLLLMFPGN
jgi:hypothetical protein